jgi:signal transduction histidine kinase/ligand-binding sensor domain-containing protein/DNA-binding response OmpR family regulator
MSLKRIINIVILILAFNPLFVNGQKVRFYNSEQGLPNSIIHKVSQDNLGFIWIATENGASYFDGIHFTTFNHDPDKNGTLSNNLVKTIYTDSQGTIWIGTSNGLQIFNREDNTFIDIPVNFPSFSGTPYISSITEYKKQGKVLISVSGLGILFWNVSDRSLDLEFTKEFMDLNGMTYPGNLFIDSNNFLWSYSEQGSFFRIDMETRKSLKINWDSQLSDICDKITVSSITEDPLTHNLLIGTYNHGILIYDKALNKIRKPKGNNPNGLRIRALLAERKNDNHFNQSIWVGSEDFGLRKFDRLKEEIIMPDFQYAPIDLENCKVHSIIQDKQGNIWAGIFQKGLLLIPNLTNNFEYIKITEKSGSMSANIACVTSITRSKEGDLWVGTDGGGLFSILSDGKKIRYTKDNTPLHNNAVLTLTSDKNGTIWISTYMGGIITYNSTFGFQNYSSDIELQKVICTAYDSINNKIYFGTLGHGVKVLSVNEKKIESINCPGMSGWINSLNIDNSGLLWIGNTEGIRCFNLKDGKEDQIKITSIIKGITISSLLKHTDGSMWFGSSEGLYHYNIDVDSLVQYTKDDGLPSNLIYAILPDNNGKLWISTINGLSLFDPSDKNFRNFYIHDGLQDNEFRSKSAFKDKDGKLYFGGINGISAFYPEKIYEEEKLSSKLYFTGLTVLNNNITYDVSLGNRNILDKHISQAEKITLKKNENVFSIEFGVLEYSNPQKVVYSYMLEGFEKEWRKTGFNNRIATYTNLPEGSYILHVRASFEGCKDDQSFVTNKINVQILPPWFKSWWAYLIYLSLFMFSIWEILNIAIRRRIRIKERLESEKKEMKLSMFTNLTHEIRTPFTLVMTPLKSMRDSETDERKKEMFNLIYRNILRILRLLNQLIDIRKIDNQQYKLHFTKIDLVYFIRDIMKSFDQLAIMRNIDFRLVTNIDSLEAFIDNVDFDKVIFNILSNAFKFTPDNGYIMLSLDKVNGNKTGKNNNNKNEWVKICIENSGPKIDEKDIEKIFERFYQSGKNINNGSGIGLYLAKMIVELHGGIIKADNSENGVIISIQLPLCSQKIDKEETLGTNNLDSQNNITSQNHNDISELIDFNDNSLSNTTHKNKRLARSLVFIDDDADLCRYIKMELSDKYLVETFTDAKDAWKQISTTIPDAVITDLLMPDTDGLSLCNKIRQNPETNHIPIIILTSQTGEESKQICFENGADQYITKPLNLELLRSTISQTIKTRDTIKNKYRSNFHTDFEELQINSPESRLITKVIESIRKNIENPEFNIDDLSKEVGLSRVHLNRKLKENLNISPNNLIRSIRLKQAAYLLINNKVNISDVAYKVGFSSHSYFSNNFKEYFGMAPTEFINKYNNPEDKETLSKLFE